MTTTATKASSDLEVSLAPVADVNPWAFWAPSPDGIVERALQLAGVGPGTGFLDLGCGDGRILVAAARLGARVRGVDINPLLVERARASLQAADLEGEVEVGDMFTAPIAADVVYAYLTPVTLTRLRPGLMRAASGTRVVTPHYAITSWKPSRVEGGCYLYELPAQDEAPPPRTGWESRAALLVLPADRRVLSTLTLSTNSERVALAFDPQLARAAEYATGLAGCMRPAYVPVDLIFNAHGVGSVIAGEIWADGEPITVAAVFARGGLGHWTFSADEGAQFRARLDAAIAAARAATG